MNRMKIAVAGCAHGDLENIYGAIEHLEKKHSFKIDLLLCCGDFQSVRNTLDLECMAVPKCYRQMQSFHKFYSAELTAPILTIFIGGNHEASNYLAELPYGGWVCPNIYYMGYASVVRFGGLRIGGLSGIFKDYHYHKGHFERYPYNNDTVRSAYHVRHLEVFRLKQLSNHIDIFFSHDWPRGVYHHGDVHQLLRLKPFFRQEVESGKLGSLPAAELLEKLKPDYWFSAHLHIKFSAIVKHGDGISSTSKTTDRKTRFLALDKCLPRRDFLQILDIPHDENAPLNLQYDPEWLCILKLTDHLLSTSKHTQYMPGPGSNERYDFAPTEEELSQVLKLFNDDLTIPQNFVQTAPVFDSSSPQSQANFLPVLNPQTTSLCSKLGVTDPVKKLLHEAADFLNDLEQIQGIAAAGSNISSSFIESSSMSHSLNPDEISLSDDDETSLGGLDPSRSTDGHSANPDETSRKSNGCEDCGNRCTDTQTTDDFSKDGHDTTSTGLSFVIDRTGGSDAIDKKCFRGRNANIYSSNTFF